MAPNQSEILALKFAEAMGRLRALGLRGDVAVSAGVVLISTADRGSAAGFRKAIKAACARSGAVFSETRPAKGAYVFTVAT